MTSPTTYGFLFVLNKRREMTPKYRPITAPKGLTFGRCAPVHHLSLSSSLFFFLFSTFKLAFSSEVVIRRLDFRPTVRPFCPSYRLLRLVSRRHSAKSCSVRIGNDALADEHAHLVGDVSGKVRLHAPSIVSLVLFVRLIPLSYSSRTSSPTRAASW